MRQRSVQFLAFVGSATAFLVGAGVSDGARSTAFFLTASVATALSFLSILFVLFVLLSIDYHGGIHRILWNFRVSSQILVDHWIDPEVGAASEAKFLRNLALQYDKMAEENDPSMTVVRRWYLSFLTFGSIQVITWAGVVWAFT